MTDEERKSTNSNGLDKTEPQKSSDKMTMIDEKSHDSFMSSSSSC